MEANFPIGIEDAFEEGGVLHGKKVYLFSCTEPQLLFFNGQSKVTCIPVVVAVRVLKLKDSNLKYIYLCQKKIEKLNLVIKELVKEKDEEKESLNGVIACLLVEKEKDKVDKDVMLNRMSQIEAMLTVVVRR
ncbi:putative protein HEAT INTOLERANT 4 [Helianthus debilis subsp. tardiflorus]